MNHKKHLWRIVFGVTSALILGAGILYSQSIHTANADQPMTLNRTPADSSLVYLPLVTNNFSNYVYVDVANTGIEDGSIQHPYNTIQKGIDHSIDGSIVVVLPGLYLENVVVPYANPRHFTVRSKMGAAQTIIDGNTQHSTFTVLAGSITIDGFTIQNAGGSSGWSADGYGIVVQFNGSPQTITTDIRNNIIEDNRLRGGVGVISNMANSHVVISVLNNRIMSNSILDTSQGGGIVVAVPDSTTGSVMITNNIIASNTGYCGGGLDVVGGYYPNSFTTDAINNTVVSNTAMYGGGICANTSDLNLTNNIVFFNSASYTGSDLYLVQKSLSATVSYNIIGDGQYAGSNGNISSNPLFVDPLNGNWHLQAGSPAIDSGTTVTVTTDLDGNLRPCDGNGDSISQWDIGAYEFCTN